jgi:hypothetical protein
MYFSRCSLSLDLQVVFSSFFLQTINSHPKTGIDTPKYCEAYSINKQVFMRKFDL